MPAGFFREGPVWLTPVYYYFIIPTLGCHRPTCLRTYLKKRILVQNQGGREVQPGGILVYFEDLNRAPNAEFGPISLRAASYARQEDFFEMGSILSMSDGPATLNH